jgi:hypothetical protein
MVQANSGDILRRVSTDEQDTTGQTELEALAEQLDEMTLHDETGDPRDEGYMDAVRELREWHTQRTQRRTPR